MDVDLPDSLKARTIGAIAQRCANDDILARQAEQIAKGRRALRFLVIGMAILTSACFLLDFIASWSAVRTLAGADQNRRDAQALLDRRVNGLRAVRERTFGSRFYMNADGWFIDFPQGTKLKTSTYPAPAVQVLPPR